MVKGGYRFKFLLGILVFNQLISIGQDELSNVPGKIDSIKVNTSAKHSLYSTYLFSDNLVIASSVSHRQPYYTASLSYFFKNSLYLGAAAFHLPGFQSFPAFNTVMAGYQKTFNSWLDVDMSLYGYSVSDNLETTLFRSFLSTELEVGLDWNLVYTEVSASKIFGEGGSVFYQMKNSRYVEIPGLFRNKLRISLQPYAELVFGSMLKIEAGETTYTSIKSSIARWSNGPYRQTESDTGSESQGESSGSGPEGSGSGTGGGSAPGPGTGNSNNPGPASSGTDQELPGTDNGSDPGVPGGDNGSDSGLPGGYNGNDSELPDGNNAGDSGSPGNENNTGYINGDSGSDSQSGTQIPNGSETEPATNSGNNSPSGQQQGEFSPTSKPGSGPGSKGTLSSKTSGPVITSYRFKDFFGLMEIGIGLPVNFKIGKFMFEIEPGYVKSMYNDPDIPVSEGFTFTIGASIRLF